VDADFSPVEVRQPVEVVEAPKEKKDRKKKNNDEVDYTKLFKKRSGKKEPVKSNNTNAQKLLQSQDPGSVTDAWAALGLEEPVAVKVEVSPWHEEILEAAGDEDAGKELISIIDAALKEIEDAKESGEQEDAEEEEDLIIEERSRLDDVLDEILDEAEAAPEKAPLYATKNPYEHLDVVEYKTWCYQVLSTKVPLGTINGVGPNSLKASCQRCTGLKQAQCKLWITLKDTDIAARRALEFTLVKWLSEAAHTSGSLKDFDNHQATAYQIKREYGMNVKKPELHCLF